MKRIRIVARWEFLSAVMSGSFIGLALGLPLVHIGIALLMGLSLQTAEREQTAAKPIVVVDRHELMAAGTVEDGSVVRDEAAAFQQLREQRVDAVVLLDDAYPATGRVRIYAHRKPGFLNFGATLQRRGRAETVIRRAMVARLPPSGDRDRIVRPIAEVDRFQLDANGAPVPDSGAAIAILGGTFGVSFLLGLSIFLSAGLLQNAMAAERENRMLEVLLVSVRPWELLTGKVIGLGAAGLLQISIYLVLALGAAPALLGLYAVPVSVVLWSIACFATGYVLYASLMAATGAIAKDTNAATQLATIWMLAGAAPMFFITVISAEPNAIVSRVLTWIPLTAPVALLLRIGGGTIDGLHIAAPLFLALLTAVFTLRLSARLLGRVAVGMDFRLVRRRGEIAAG